MLSPPYHRRHVNAEVHAIKRDFATLLAIVQKHATGSANADQKLMAKFVRVLSSDLAARDVKDDEITLGRKRNVTGKLADREIAAHIVDEAKLVERASPDTKLRGRGFPHKARTVASVHIQIPAGNWAGLVYNFLAGA